MPVGKQNVEDVFTYHAPAGDDPAHYEALRAAAKLHAIAIIEHTPQCADQQAALRHVREASMTANAAVALKGAV